MCVCVWVVCVSNPVALRHEGVLAGVASPLMLALLAPVPSQQLPCLRPHHTIMSAMLPSMNH